MKKLLLCLTLFSATVLPAVATTNRVVSAVAFATELKPYDDKIITLQGRIDALRARHGKQKVDVKQIRELTAQIGETRRLRRLKAIELSEQYRGKKAEAASEGGKAVR